MRFYSVAAPAALALIVTAGASPARAQAPPSTRERPALGSTITVDVLAELPANASLLSLLDAAQSDVIADRLDTGGLSTGEAARIGSHGSSWTQARFRVGAANINDPDGSGSPMLLPDMNAWERVDVATGLVPIEVNAPGLAIGLEPRRPAPSWTRVVEGLFSRPALLARSITTTPPAVAHLDAWNHVNLFASGPIDPGRLGIAIDGDWTRSTRFERDNPTRLDASVGSLFTHLEFTPDAQDQIRSVVWLQRTRTPFVNRTVFGQPSAAERAIAFHAQSTWDRQVGELAWTMFASYTERQRKHDVDPSPTIVLERLTDGPVPEVLNPPIGTDQVWSAGARVRLPAAIVLGRRHTLGGGIEASGASARTRAGFAGRVGELVDGLPARAWDYFDTGRDSRLRENALRLYVSDRVELMPRVLLEAGIRFESMGGSAQDSANPVRWNNWLPRGSLRWEITEAARLAAFAGYGRYGWELPLKYFSYGDANGQVGNVHAWNATRADRLPQPADVGPLVARVGPGTGGDPRFSAIDAGLRRPYMDEFVTGFESRPRPSAVIRLAAIARREQQLVGLTNVGVPASSYGLVRVPDPGVDLLSAADDQLLGVFNRSRASFGADRYLLTNPADDQSTFVGVDFTGQVTVEHLFLLLGATAGRSEGLSGNRGFEAIENDQGVVGELFTNPNATTNARGRLFTERGYTLKTAGVYRFAHDVRLGLVGRYQDGQHFARLVIVSGLNQGAEAVRAFPNGRTRFTYSLTVDARLQKGFTVGPYRLEAIVDAYNLLNRAKEIEEYPVTGSAARVSAAVQPPRAIHLGARITF